MTLLKRIIACLDVDEGRVVKGVEFVNLTSVGDPAAMAERYEADGADEIVFLDVSATHSGRATLLDVVSRTAQRLFIPLTVGGGVRTVSDVDLVLRAGADKVAVNSAAVSNPLLLTEASVRFGAQCIVASIDARSREGGWEVYVNGGRVPTGLDAIDWARRCADLGAGEILMTSIDRDGTRYGYDLDLVAQVSEAVNVPVIASGGAGNAKHISEAFTSGADAALLAGILHDGTTDLLTLKAELLREGHTVRRAA
ncbi:MAG: imidazole glycerol phosphate synthase subunit HisF [Gemmatimonadaceae bacterium]|nr:imidazole glycerol phosphate synthase subunit HisF [Gemmatimonadaceae bacterium]